MARNRIERGVGGQVSYISPARRVQGGTAWIPDDANAQPMTTALIGGDRRSTVHDSSARTAGAMGRALVKPHGRST
jgi:hypothetical protein